MDQVAWILALVFAFIVAPLLLWSMRERRGRRGIPSDPQTQEDQNLGQEVVRSSSSTERAIGGGTRRMRRRPVSTAAASSSSSVVAVAEQDGAGNDSEDAAMEATYYKAKQLKKKKQEKKQENEARRQAEVEARDMRREKQDRQADIRRQKDEEREAEESRREEEAEERKLEMEAAAAKEFQKWKVAFSVETEGTEVQESSEEGQGLLNDFVSYIKEHKCVDLEDLAAEFNMKTQDCVNRLEALEQIGRISGLMDERGKFIYISPEEMKSVADYIKRLGRQYDPTVSNSGLIYKKRIVYTMAELKRLDGVLNSLEEHMNSKREEAQLSECKHSVGRTLRIRVYLFGIENDYGANDLMPLPSGCLQHALPPKPSGKSRQKKEVRVV